MRLQDKVAIVTGGASGIGRGTALLMAGEGAKVIVADVDEEGARETVSMIESKEGKGVSCYADVGTAKGVEEMIGVAVDSYGKIDVLHNNAYWHSGGTAMTISEEDWDHTLDVCLKAVYMGCKLAIPQMLKTGGGAVVNTASIHSLVSFHKYAAYDAAKAGVIGLTRSLALDFGPQIRANAVLPGAILTAAWSGIDQEEMDHWARMTPMKRMGQPEDIAKAVIFLASDDASFITGTSLVVDGGWTIVGHPRTDE